MNRKNNTLISIESALYSKSAAYSQEIKLSILSNSNFVEMMASSQATSSAKNLNQTQYHKSVCEICNVELDNKWHKRRTHDLGERVAKKSYDCYLCRRQFKQHRESPKHFRLEHMKKLEYREYRYKCRECRYYGEDFNDFQLLSIHYLWHKDQLKGRKHKCEVYHMVTHTSVKVAIKYFDPEVLNSNIHTRSHS